MEHVVRIIGGFYGNYKKIIDCICVTNHNEDYLEMSIEIRSHKDCP